MKVIFLLFMTFLLFYMFDFGFFSYMIFLEMFMINMMLLNFIYNNFFSSMNGIFLLFLGACEVALGLNLLVINIRVGSLDRVFFNKCLKF